MLNETLTQNKTENGSIYQAYTLNWTREVPIWTTYIPKILINPILKNPKIRS